MDTIFDSIDDSSKIETIYKRGNVELINGDAFDVMPTIDRVDAIVTDPPYATSFGWIYKPLAEQAFRLLPEGGSLLCLTGCFNHYLAYYHFSKLLNWEWTFGMRHPQNTQIVHTKDIICMHKPCLWFVKGQRKEHDVVGDLWASEKRDKDYHEWGQSVGWFGHYISICTEVGDVILDPFMGGGTTIIDAIDLNRAAIGIEKDRATFDIAVERVDSYLDGR